MQHYSDCFVIDWSQSNTPAQIFIQKIMASERHKHALKGIVACGLEEKMPSVMIVRICDSSQAVCRKIPIAHALATAQFLLYRSFH